MSVTRALPAVEDVGAQLPPPRASPYAHQMPIRSPLWPCPGPAWRTRRATRVPKAFRGLGVSPKPVSSRIYVAGVVSQDS